MKKNLKLIALLAGAVLTVGSMTACGNSKTESENSQKNIKTSETVVSEADWSLPTELSDNLFDYQFQVGGTVLSSPITLRHLKEAGWTSDESKHVAFNPDAEYAIDFQKDNVKISVLAKNNTDEEVTDRLSDEGSALIDAENISCNTKLNDEPILLPKDIAAGLSTKDDVTAAYGEPNEKGEQFAPNGGKLTGYIYYYWEDTSKTSYKDVSKYVAVTVEKNDDGKFVVTGVTLHNDKDEK